MIVLNRIDWEVLNATADDWENLEQLYLMLTHADNQSNGATPSLQEIADSICRLAEAGLLEARWENGDSIAVPGQDLHYVWQAWFRMTAPGRNVWNASTLSAVSSM